MQAEERSSTPGGAANHAIECRDCGLLQRGVALAPRESARCVDCGAVLYRDVRACIERSLALTCGALILLVIAHACEFMSFAYEGRSRTGRIVTGVASLAARGDWPVAALVLTTSLLAPLLHLSGMLCVLIPIHSGRPAGYVGPLFRRLQILRPWSMLEVYLLGALVAIVKLRQLANVELAAGFWAFVALMLVATASYAVLEPRQVWEGARPTDPGGDP